MEKLINEYLNTLNEKEKISIEVAKKILQKSYDIEKSIGFIKWKINRKK